MYKEPKLSSALEHALRTFDKLAQEILVIVVGLNDKLDRAVTSDEIAESYRREFSKNITTKTIATRTCRMVKEGWLETPTQGLFVAVK